MEKEIYKRQVALLLSVLPEIAKEPDFALHGGTAINLFIRDMPRLSVDIDMTYIPIEGRTTSLSNIASALLNIKKRIGSVLPNAQVAHKEREGKLLISVREASIKLEVNLTNRGILSETIHLPLCNKAQDVFDVFCMANVVPLGQLFGGKICAALDRQHPRDLFDVKYLLENEGFSRQVKEGFLMLLLSSDRPVHEILNPHLQDQRSALTNQFAGMTNENFNYEEYETVRNELIITVQKSLTDYDKQFLLSVKGLKPDWSVYPFQRFPAVQWKLKNLQQLKDNNPQKHLEQYNQLKTLLDSLPFN
ncbi:MAG: nucleotidyl transferase AbiEii/AbiGii toxin family protein [Chitinophagaceae bacterium]|nr:MAG: nucleotidyl transferase AbiEii/AbiGii toxin family protein [Chitinophagaceae bacterium]